MNPNVLEIEDLILENHVESSDLVNPQRMINKLVNSFSKAPNDDSFSTEDERERDEVDALAEQLDNVRVRSNEQQVHSLPPI